MLHLSSPPLGVLGLGIPEILVIGAVLMFPLMIVAIVTSALYFKFRQRQQWQDLVRVALEKGQPLPPYPGQHRHETEKSWQEFALSQAARHQQCRRRRPLRDVRAGLVLLAFGAAVYLAMPPTKPGNNTGFLIFAYVPAFIGVALLLNGVLETFFARKDDTPGPQPPAS